MTDDPIGDALRALPGETADPDFTAGVLARLDARPAAARPSRAWGPAAVAVTLAAALALMVVVGRRLDRDGTPAGPAGAVAATDPVTGAGALPAATGEEPRSAALEIARDSLQTPAASSSIAAGASTAAGAPVAGEPAFARGPGGGPARASAGESARIALARAELAELRRRHDRFASELRRLSDLAGGGSPVVYVGGDENFEVVLDLSRPELGPTPAPAMTGGAAVRPAESRPSGDRPHPRRSPFDSRYR